MTKIVVFLSLGMQMSENVISIQQSRLIRHMIILIINEFIICFHIPSYLCRNKLIGKKMTNKEYEAKLLALRYPKPDGYGSLSMPIYNSLAFEFETAESMELAFSGAIDDHVYSRVTNPTVQHFEDRVRAITGAYGVTALNSGMAAISNTFFTLAWSGCNIVTSNKLFGNTYSFFVNTLRDFGVETRFVDLKDFAAVELSIDKNTCALFAEIITNPQMEIVDLNKLSEIAHRNKVPFVADTTLIPFSSFTSSQFGIDIDVISSTKYISGGGTSLGGLIIDYGKFDWSYSPKLKTVSDNSFSSFNYKLRKEIHRNIGAYMTPQTAYMQSLGLESMGVRYERQSKTCKQLALMLRELPEVASVGYPGLDTHSDYLISLSQFGDTPGAMLIFDLQSKDKCFEFIKHLKLIRRATNLFDNRSLILHPASTIYVGFSKQQRAEMDVRDTTMRLSVGLEDVDSLFEDIKKALEYL